MQGLFFLSTDCLKFKAFLQYLSYKCCLFFSPLLGIKKKDKSKKCHSVVSSSILNRATSGTSSISVMFLPIAVSMSADRKHSVLCLILGQSQMFCKHKLEEPFDL